MSIRQQQQQYQLATTKTTTGFDFRPRPTDQTRGYDTLLLLPYSDAEAHALQLTKASNTNEQLQQQHQWHRTAELLTVVAALVTQRAIIGVL